MGGRKKAIVDVNIWLSFVIGKTIKKLDEIIEQDRVTFVISEELLAELRKKAGHKRFKKYFKYSKFLNFLAKLEEFSEKIEPTSVITECRDPKDNYLLALSIDADATYLVTGDNDLLEIKNFRGVEIVRFSDFMELFED